MDQLGLPAGSLHPGSFFLVPGNGGPYIVRAAGGTQTYAIPQSLQFQQSAVVAAHSEAPPPPPPPPPPPVAPRVPKVDLYLCNTSAGDQLSEQDSEKERRNVSIAALEQSYQELNCRKIKDSLGSFLPDIPGEFDSVDTNNETSLRGLVERPPIGGKEFLPLSGQALLGFRLLPGAPLPEQLCLDPPSAAEPKHSHRKRKHKHRSLDKSNVSSDSLASSHHAKFPTDAYDFIKHESPSSSVLHSHHSPHPHMQYMPGLNTPSVLMQAPARGGHPYQVGIHGVAGAAQPIGELTRITTFEKKRKKEKKRDRDKDRDKDKERRKEKKKRKKEKHHGQEPPTAIHVPSHTPVPPPLISKSTFPHSHPSS